MKIQKCAKCGKIIKKNAAFCTECGEPVKIEPVRESKEISETEKNESVARRENNQEIKITPYMVIGLLVAVALVTALVSSVVTAVTVKKMLKSITPETVEETIASEEASSASASEMNDDGTIEENSTETSEVEEEESEEASLLTSMELTQEENSNTEKNVAEQEEAESDYALNESEVSVEEKTVWDADGIIVTTLGLDEDSNSYKLKLAVENTTGTDYNVAPRAWAVNGVMCNDWGSFESVPAGKKTKFEVKIKKEWMKKVNISEIQFIDVTFTACEGYTTKICTEMISIPTSLFSNSTYVPMGNKVYEDSDIEVWRQGYKFTLLNKSGYDVYCSWKDASVNEWGYDFGEQLGSFDSEIIPKDDYRVFDVEFDDDFLKENDIDSVETFDFKLSFTQAHIRDTDKYASGYKYETETISVTMK